MERKVWNIIKMNLVNIIKKLPKAELHLHIEGSLEPELMLRLAKKNKVSLKYKNVQEIKNAYNFSNLQSFLDIYYEGSKVLLEEQDFYDLTWEYLLKCKEDNVVHTELFFDPQGHTSRGVSFDKVINGIHRSLEDGKSKLGISSYLIMCFLRHESEDDAMKTLESALPFKNKFIGVGLDSSELGNPPNKFERVFSRAREEGLFCVAHAGEEGPPDYIWQALDVLKVKRIDHGVRALEDLKLIARLKAEQIPLTVCPLSNVKLKVFDSIEKHNLKELLGNGLLVTINSDDPAYFGGYLLQNYLETSKGLDLSINDLISLAKNSFKASFLPEIKKREFIDLIDSLTPGLD